MNNKIKITHDISDFHEGQQIILTLKDQYLLKDDGLNQDQEQLQNIQLRQKGQIQFKRYMRQNIHKLADVNRSHLQSKLEGNAENVLLPHYDQRKYQKQGIDIDIDQDNNELVVTKGILEKIKQQKQQKQQQALNLKQNVIASEYLQPEKKVIKARKIVDKQKQMKQLMSFLEQDAEGEEKSNDKTNSEMRKKQIEQANKRNQSEGKYDERNFDKAVKKAEDKVRAIEEYQLELALLKHKNKFKLPKPQQSSALESQSKPAVQTKVEPKTKLVEMELDPIMAFHKGAKDSLQQISYTSNLSLKDTKSGSASVLNVPLPSQRFLNRQKQLQKQQQIPESFQQIPEQQLNAMKKQLEFMEQEQNVGVGLSGTLKYLRQKGMLNKQQFVGRSNDQKVNFNKPGDRVVLQYRDERGRLLTQKQAYRLISQRFHGQASGKNKLQSRRKKQLMQQKLRSRQSGGTTMMNILQSQTEQAHMFIKRQ